MTGAGESGFEIIEGVLSPEECGALAGALPAEGRAGSRHLMSHPAVAALTREGRMMAIARRWVGSGAVPYRATLFEKSGLRNWLAVWHQDTALPLAGRNPSDEWESWSVKGGIHYAHAPAWALGKIVALRVHLDPSTRENGPLRVVAGSHSRGVLADDEVFRMGREGKVAECVVGLGGVLALRPLLVHASSKSSGPAARRVLHLEYAASLDLAPGIRLALS